MISVIVCTYNQEDTIGRTLESILRQECDIPVEIVVGEDCSQDNTLQVCRTYAERYPDRIRILANKQNKGIVNNYFDCLLECKGCYIADCAGDDFWIDDRKLQKEMEVLDAHPEVGIVHTDWQRYSPIEGKTSPSPKAVHTDFITDGTTLLPSILAQTERPVIHLCTALYRADWIREAHDKHTEYFRQAEYGCEDLQVCFFLAQMGKVAYLPDITLNYSCGGETISNSKDFVRQYHFFYGVSLLSIHLALEYGLKEKLKPFISTRIYTLMMFAFRAHDKSLREEALHLPALWGARWNARMVMWRLATSCHPLWQTALLLRNLKISLANAFKRN